MDCLFELRDRSAGFAGRTVLHNIDLAVRAGERVAIMGRSGSGKSTLLNMIHADLGARAALIPQAAALVGPLSVFHNVYMGRLERRSTFYNLTTLVRPRRQDLREIEDLLRQVGLEEKLHEKAASLSGGQQQRTSVARALYNGRPIVIGDEPVSALDRTQGAEILGRLCAAHETVLLAMHDIPLALQFTQRVVVLEHGRIALDAPTSTLKPADLLPYYGG